MINAAEQFKPDQPLSAAINPFSSGAGAPRSCSPIQTALEEIIRHIENRCRIVVVTGNPGTGKTLLVGMIASACLERGLSARQIDRPDLTETSPGTPSDVLLVDQADSIPTTALDRLTSPRDGSPTTYVFLCHAASSFGVFGSDAKIVELQELSIPDARTSILEQANSIGRPALFSPDAIDLIVHRAAGSCRSLRLIASLAFSTAAWESERQIGVRHIDEVLASPMFSFPHADGKAGQSKPAAEQIAQSHSDLPDVVGLGGYVGPENGTTLHPLKQPAVRRMTRLAGIAVGIAASMGLVVAAAGLLLGSKNIEGGLNLGLLPGAPTVSEPLQATVEPAPTLSVAASGANRHSDPAAIPPESTLAETQSPAAAPSSPANQDAASDPGSLIATAPPHFAGQPSPVASDLRPSPAAQARTVLRPGASPSRKGTRLSATKRSGPSVRANTRRISARVAAANEAKKRAREAEEMALHAQQAARQADEAARQAADAQRQADDAARRADDAVRYATNAVRHADNAARQAEAIARQADRGIRIILRPPPQRR